jgi:hypothetical protein
MGIISLVVGIILTFAGSKAISIVMGFLVGTAVFLISFVIGAVVITGTGAAIGFAVVGLILGGLAGYYSAKFVEDYGVKIIAFVASAVIVFILVSSVP